MIIAMVTSKPHVNEDAAKRMFDLIGNPVVELRALRRKGHFQKSASVGFFTDPKEFAETAAGLSSDDRCNELFQGVFMTINSLSDEFRGLATGLVAPGSASKDQSIVRLRTLFIDVDAVRQHPDGGKVCSTDEEHAAAVEAATSIVAFLRSLGWPQPLVMDSGSGAYVISRIDLPNTPECAALITAVLETIAAKCGTSAVHIDTGVGNPSRVVRIAGTINRKSDHSEERPNRVVRILSAPANDQLQLVTLEQLNALAGTSIHPTAPSAAPSPPTGSALDELEAELHKSRVSAVLDYLDRAKMPHVAPKENDSRFTKIESPYCPFKGVQHDDGNTAVLIWRNGGISVKCFHEKCRDKSWPQLQTALGLEFSVVANELATKSTTGQVKRVFDDPLILAERHIKKWASHDGTPTLTHFLGETFRHDATDGWVKTTHTELAPWLRETVQEAFDAHAHAVAKLEGRAVAPKPIRGQIVADTFKAMVSLCKRDVSIKTQSPFWLEPYKDWNADDLLVFANGILNIPEYLEGCSGCFIPPTPKLFHEHQCAFEFNPKAPSPKVWHDFLKSLQRSDEWYQGLQEIMGYCLWQKYDLQKYVMIVGPSRSGKGTIVRVTRDIVGGVSAVCAPSLKHFAKSFGLEQAISKRLALVPEVKPPNDCAEIVANIKAITGGDLVTVDRKNIPNIPMLLKIKIVMQSNNFVVLPDNSGALHARLILLTLGRSFVGEEDLELKEKLQPEYPGILLWALNGLRRLWKANGVFTIPQESRRQLEQLRAASAPLQVFIQQCCALDMQHGCESPALYEIYKAWFNREHRGDAPLSDVEFAKELTTAASSVVKSRATTPGATEKDGFTIVRTDFDGHSDRRAPLWLGIMPAVEWRTQATRN